MIQPICKFTACLPDYLSGNLAPESAQLLEDHLVACVACNQMLVEMLDGTPAPGWMELLKDQRSAATQRVTGVSRSVTAESRYAKVRRLGAGGMGVVWEGWDHQLQRTVALKHLSPLNCDVSGVQRLQQEAEALARLSHPQIVTIHELVNTPLQPFLVMEYVDGINLLEWTQGQPIEPRTAAELLLNISRALLHAHEAGIIHRDLKPSNILLKTHSHQFLPRGADGAVLVKLTDFGLASLPGEHQLTVTGQKLGTPTYMAPEQISGECRANVQTDVYSTGVLLYELLTGRPPFAGSDAASVMLRIQTDEPAAPRLLCPAVPRDIETICLKCLSRRPADRYDSMQALTSDLQAFLEGRPIQARPVSRFQKAVRWIARNRLLAALICLTMLTVVSTVVLALLAANRQGQLLELARKTEQQAILAARQERQQRERAEKLQVEANTRAESENALRKRHHRLLIGTLAMVEKNIQAGHDAQELADLHAAMTENSRAITRDLLSGYVKPQIHRNEVLPWDELEITFCYIALMPLAKDFVDLEPLLNIVDRSIEFHLRQPEDPVRLAEFVVSRQKFFPAALTPIEVIEQQFARNLEVANEFLQQARRLSIENDKREALMMARKFLLRRNFMTAQIVHRELDPAAAEILLNQLLNAVTEATPAGASDLPGMAELRQEVLQEQAAIQAARAAAVPRADFRK